MNQFASLDEQKALLRKELRQKLEGLGPDQRIRKSQNILEQLLSHPRFLKARILLAYAARKPEVETRPFLEEALRKGKKIFLPCVDENQKRFRIFELVKWSELRPGRYGILEPPLDPRRIGDPAELELAVIPGIGFDREGARLGRGEGYFDRFLVEAKRAYKIGLAFDCQVVEKIPRAGHDIIMDEVIAG